MTNKSSSGSIGLRIVWFTGGAREGFDNSLISRSTNTNRENEKKDDDYYLCLETDCSFLLVVPEFYIWLWWLWRSTTNQPQNPINNNDCCCILPHSFFASLKNNRNKINWIFGPMIQSIWTRIQEKTWVKAPKNSLLSSLIPSSGGRYSSTKLRLNKKFVGSVVSLYLHLLFHRMAQAYFVVHSARVKVTTGEGNFSIEMKSHSCKMYVYL